MQAKDRSNSGKDITRKELVPDKKSPLVSPPEKRDGGREPSVEFRIDTSNAGEKVKTTTVPLLAPTKLADAPTLSLKDLVPEADRRELEEQGQDESLCTDKIEFVVVEMAGEEDIAAQPEGLEWEFPDRQT